MDVDELCEKEKNNWPNSMLHTISEQVLSVGGRDGLKVR